MNAFDKIAAPKKSASKSKTVKIAAEVTKDIKTKVDLVINHKAKIAALKAEQEAAEQAIRDHVRPQQDRKAYAGEFAKSFTVEGNNGAVTCTTSDKFSVPQEEAELEAVRALMGKEFDKAFESRRTITLNPSAANNEVLIDKIVKAAKAAGLELADVFTVSDTIVARDGLDKDQYTYFDEEKLAEFRALVTQARASIK